MWFGLGMKNTFFFGFVRAKHHWKVSWWLLKWPGSLNSNRKWTSVLRWCCLAVTSPHLMCTWCSFDTVSVVLHSNVNVAGASNFHFIVFQVSSLVHHQHLSQMGFCDHWYVDFSRLLTPKQRQQHLRVCEDIKQQDEPNFTWRIISGDEGCVYGYDPQTKQQSSQRKVCKIESSQSAEECNYEQDCANSTFEKLINVWVFLPLNLLLPLFLFKLFLFEKGSCQSSL